MDKQGVGRRVQQAGFSTVEKNGGLDASELEDILADKPQRDNGKAKAEDPNREKITEEEQSDEGYWDFS